MATDCASTLGQVLKLILRMDFVKSGAFVHSVLVLFHPYNYIRQDIFHEAHGGRCFVIAILFKGFTHRLVHLSEAVFPTESFNIIKLRCFMSSEQHVCYKICFLVSIFSSNYKYDCSTGLRKHTVLLCCALMLHLLAAVCVFACMCAVMHPFIAFIKRAYVVTCTHFLIRTRRFGFSVQFAHAAMCTGAFIHITVSMCARACRNQALDV